jgi:CubicO group peptidase (beta-lactamase class C family)
MARHRVGIMNILLSLSLFSVHSNVSSHPVEKDQILEDSITALAQKDRIAAMSCCVIKNNEVVWQWSYGWADIENKIPATNNTLFMLASISKTITGTTLMHLYDKGKFKLDDDINTYLPFTIRNPEFPDDPITIRMLLDHTSTLHDDFDLIDPLYGNGDVTEPSIGDLVKAFFTEDGEFYRPSNFINKKPGECEHYSNLNFVVVSYLVECISQKPFSEYCKNNLLIPLDMKNSSWFISDLDTNEVALNYAADTTQSNGLKRIEHYGWPGYADGGFHSSVSQYTNFLSMMMNNGKFDDKQILSPETISEIFKPQKIKEIPQSPNALPMVDRSLIWKIVDISAQEYYAVPSGLKTYKYYAHTGGGTGINTLVLFDPVGKNGLIWFCTGEAEIVPTYLGIFKLLLKKLVE